MSELFRARSSKPSWYIVKERARNNSDISGQAASLSKQIPQSSQKLTSPKSPDQNPVSRSKQFLMNFQRFKSQETEFYERKVVDPATELKGVAIGVPAGIALVTTGTALVNATPAALALVPKALQFTAKQVPKFLKSLVGKAKEAPEIGTKLTKQRITKYLEKVHEVPREQLVQDLESIGLKPQKGSGDGRFLKFKHKETEQFNRVEIHEPHPGKDGAQYPHLHIRNKQGQPLSKDLAPVDFRSPEAHIEVQELPKLNPKETPK